MFKKLIAAASLSAIVLALKPELPQIIFNDISYQFSHFGDSVSNLKSSLKEPKAVDYVLVSKTPIKMGYSIAYVKLTCHEVDKTNVTEFLVTAKSDSLDSKLQLGHRYNFKATYNPADPIQVFEGNNPIN